MALNNIGSRLGNLDELPDDLRKQLKVKPPEQDLMFLAILNNLNGAATLDEIIVSAWRKHGIILKRHKVAAKLYLMRIQGKLAEKKPTDPKSTFRLPFPPKENK